MHPASNSNMAPQRSQLFTRLRRAIQNVRNLQCEQVDSLVDSPRSSSSLNRHRFSFRSQPSGLLDCCSTGDEYYEAGSSFALSRSTSLATDATSRSSPASDTTRTTSGASSSTDDIDRRSEEFIANFYRHIQMERQVSLELRYCKGIKDLVRTRSQ